MTATGLRTPAPGGSTAPALPALRWPWGRRAWLFLASRRVPTALAALAALGLAMRAALEWHWSLGSAGSAAQAVPVLIEGGAAAVVAVSTHSPFGEPERAAGRWLPWLRLGTAVALTAAAFGALAAGVAGAGLSGGSLDLLRNVAGMAGLGLLTAVVTGGLLAWVGPLGYMMLAEIGLTAGWGNPLLWPGRPPHDLGGALCASLVFAAGLIATTVRGARDASHE
ncbi:MAG: hypothetical protein ACHP9Z_17605 [Streptosporangiales bacterium]